MSRPAWAEIDIGAFDHNLELVRKTAATSRILAVIKANGYGHGIIKAAKALSNADALGVASIDEAMQIRQAGIDKRLVLLEGVFEKNELDIAARNKLDLVVHNKSQIDYLCSDSPLSGSISVWLKVDTGMHRLGFEPHEVATALSRLKSVSYLESPLVIMTHLANADNPEDSFTASQLVTFNKVVSSIEGREEIQTSICNSAALLTSPQAHGEWVRPGIMLYGISPFPGKTGAELGLKPVMSVKSRLIDVKRVKENQPVGYGGTWRCPEDMTIGVVAFGYGDGYPRHAANGTRVLVNDRPAQLVGRVSMDMLTIDLSGHEEAGIGDEVVLWGNKLPVETLAQSADTIAYELVCGVTQRVRFVDI